MPPAPMDRLIEADRMINEGKLLEAEAACKAVLRDVSGKPSAQGR